MKTYSGSNAGSQIEPVLWNARESVWIISPWLGKDYAVRLASLSQKGTEVRLITSNVDYNIESLEVLKASENSNLMLLVLNKDKPDAKANFIHAKIYLADRKYAISGSANLTYSGLNSNVESLSIAETEEEILMIERDFMSIWMDFERKSMSKDELVSGSTYSIRNALPLSSNFREFEQLNIEGKELIYRPYYFFEFIFRGSVRSPPLEFRDNGFVVLDGVTRQIISDDQLVEEINNNPKADYVLKTDNKYPVTILKPIIQDYREAKELVLDYIINKNTRHYKQYYQNRGGYGGTMGYDRLYVPRPYEVSFVKSYFVQVPIWYIELYDPDGKKQKILYGSSGKEWCEYLYCPECQKKTYSSQSVACEVCGKKVCQNCITRAGIIFRKNLCRPCSQSA